MTTEREQLPRLVVDYVHPGCVRCPECGPSLMREFTYVDTVTRYRAITLTSRDTVQACIDTDSVALTDSEVAPRLFHAKCLTYFDPSSVAP